MKDLEHLRGLEKAYQALLRKYLSGNRGAGAGRRTFHGEGAEPKAQNHERVSAFETKVPVELSIESKEERGSEEGDHKVREDWILGALVKHYRDFGPCPKSKRKPR